MSDCVTCLPISCVAEDEFEYSIERRTQLYGYVWDCPEGAYCFTPGVPVSMDCCGHRVTGQVPPGATLEQAKEALADLVRQCMEYRKACGSGTFDDDSDGDGDPIDDSNAGVDICFSDAVCQTAACPDGQEFRWCLKAGAFMDTNCIRANAYALAEARRLASLYKVCLSDLDGGCCKNNAYTGTITATGLPLAAFPIPNYWEISAGALPPGLSFETGWQTGYTRAFSGTPTTVGSYAFKVKVTTPNGAFMEKSYRLDVLEITTASPLTDAQLGVYYSVTLAVDGETVPVTWEIESGTLPDGLALDPVSGTIMGTPETGSEGDYTFTAKVTDANDSVCTKQFQVEVIAGCAETSYDQSNGDAYSMLVSDGAEPWVVDSTAGEILHFDTDFVLQTNTALGFSPFSVRIAYSPVNQVIYIGASGAVYPFDTGVLTTGAAIVITGNPLSMVYVPEKDCVYVVSSGGGHRWLYSIDCTTNIATLLSNETVGINLFCYSMFFYDDGAAGKLYGGYVFGLGMGMWYWDFNTGTLNDVASMTGTAVYGSCFDSVAENAYLELVGAIGVFHVPSETLVSTTAYADMNNPGYFVADETLSRPYFIDTNNKLMMYDPVADTFSQVVTDGFAYYHLTMIGQCLLAVGQDGAAPNHYFLKRFNPSTF